MLTVLEDVKLKLYILASERRGELKRVLDGDRLIEERVPDERGRGLGGYALLKRHLLALLVRSVGAEQIVDRAFVREGSVADYYRVAEDHGVRSVLTRSKSELFRDERLVPEAAEARRQVPSGGVSGHGDGVRVDPELIRAASDNRDRGGQLEKRRRISHRSDLIIQHERRVTPRHELERDRLRLTEGKHIIPSSRADNDSRAAARRVNLDRIVGDICRQGRLRILRPRSVKHTLTRGVFVSLLRELIDRALTEPREQLPEIYFFVYHNVVFPFSDRKSSGTDRTFHAFQNYTTHP